MNNMQKHKNNSGFTLVELIVVMCIMGIIMGAVLNFLRPTARLYNTTNKYLNQEEAVDMIADYLKDDLMYATGVFVIRSNQADINELAQREASMVGSPFLDNFDFKNCIVLDNTSIRSSGTAAAVRSGATGTISKYALKNGSYVDVTSDPSLLQGKELYRNTFALQDQSFMGEDQYRFGVSCNTTGELCALTVHMEVASLVRDADTDTYKVHEIEFEADKPIEFMNFKTSTVTSLFGVWDDAGAYTGDDYIYIFYNRKDKITQDNVRFTCEFYLMDSEGNYMDDPVYSATVVDPADIREEVKKNVEERNLEVIEGTDGYVYRRTGYFATIKDVHDINHPNVVDLANITGSTPGETRKLYAVYTKTLKTDEKVSVNFYQDKDKSYSIKSVLDRPFGDDITSEVPAWEKETETSTGVYEVCYWASCSTDERQLSFSHITSDLDVYKASHKEYKVSFVDQSGNPAKWIDADGNEVDFVRVREGEGVLDTQLPSLNPFIVDPGDYSWVFKDGEHAGEAVDSSKPINAPTTVTIKFVPKPAVTFSTSWDSHNHWPGYCQPIIVITDTEEMTVDTKFKITMNFTSDLDNIANGPYNANKVGESITGKTLVLTVTPTGNTNRLEVNFQIKNKDGSDFDVDPSSLVVEKIS